MPSDEDNKTPTRRNALKLISGTAGAAATFAGSVSAKKSEDLQRRKEVKSEYEHSEKAFQAVDQFGENILADLKERGILKSMDVADLVPRSLQSAKQHQKGEPGVFVSSFNSNGEYTARISARVKTGSHTVELFLHPHVDNHYAAVKPSAEDQSAFVLEDAGDQEVEPQEFCTESGTICRFEGNDYNCCPPLFGCGNTEFEKIVCKDGRCYAGSHTGCCISTHGC